MTYFDKNRKADPIMDIKYTYGSLCKNADETEIEELFEWRGIEKGCYS
jgi:hypothetical protein